MSLSHPVLRPLTLLNALIVGILAIGTADASERRWLEVKHEFQRQHPCPSTGRPTGACPGFIKDHVVPLACGGPDAVSNIQWQNDRSGKGEGQMGAEGLHSRSTEEPAARP